MDAVPLLSAVFPDFAGAFIRLGRLNPVFARLKRRNARKTGGARDFPEHSPA